MSYVIRLLSHVSGPDSCFFLVPSSSFLSHSFLFLVVFPGLISLITVEAASLHGHLSLSRHPRPLSHITVLVPNRFALVKYNINEKSEDPIEVGCSLVVDV